MSLGTYEEFSEMILLLLFRFYLVVVMSVRTSVLLRNLVAHGVVQLEDKTEEMGFHLNVIVS
jgi:hypothetical protein